MMYLRICLLTVVSIWALGLTQYASAETSMWRVEKEGRHLFIGGTIHLLAAKDYPLPEAFEQAYQASEVVAFETDISGMQDPQVQGRLMMQLMYSDGRSLQSVLSTETYQRLTQYLSDKSIPIQVMNLMRAGGVSVTVTLMELQAMGLTAAGVDKFYFEKARKDQKQLVFLEPLEEQMRFIAELGEGMEDELITYTLDDLTRLPEFIDSMTANWRTGDMNALDSDMVAELRAEFPTIHQSLIVERNQNWLPKIEAMMASDQVELVLVGVAHLTGEEGVIEQLESEGYRVQQL